jgi:Uma2 family endonuclease
MIVVERRTPKPKKDLPPLVNGDHLDQKTFHERYAAMPEVRAELIGGIVYMSSSPQKIRHGYHHLKLARLADDYVDETPGIEGCVNATSILGPDAEPQPDTCFYILPEYGGQTVVDEKGYMTGAPEWVGEISDSTESIDLNRKKLDYEKAGVREYMVAAVRTKQVFVVHPPPGQIQTAYRRRRWHHPLRGFPRLLARRGRIYKSRKQAPCRSDASGTRLGGACGIRGEARQ